MDSPAIELDRVSINFGGVQALDQFSLRLGEGEIRGLIGPNGSGKSTAFNVITGLYRPGSGDIRMHGRSLLGLSTDEIAAQGIGRTFQNLRLFGAMTVIENVMLGTHLSSTPPGAFATMLGLASFRRHEAEVRERSYAILESLAIAEFAEETAGMLPYGVQKRVDLARSVIARPRVLLLDEPAAGLTEHESRQLMDLIRRLHEEFGFALLLVEHDMHFVSNLCPRITVIDFGRYLAEGTPEEIRASKEVVTAYLGTGGIGDRRRQTEMAGAAHADKSPMVSAQNLEVRYGAVPALHGVSIDAPEGQITAIVGANGAGKTTLLAAISGIVPVHSGSLLYRDSPMNRWSCEMRVAHGIVLCPEGRRLFPEMTVRENLLLGAYKAGDRAGVLEALERVFALFPRIAGRRDQKAGTLSGGEQQMVAIGRALMAEPSLLLLDEPSLGLAPNLVELIFETIVEISRTGTTIILVEQNASMALEIADRGFVLETGKVALSGSASELKARRDFVEAYLG
ncbi:MAG TPA: ATP-binding cassette domain-containing protein [Alphaproteobacteria bacterium]|nr:ATP-binding cassette domain-containing protein [Alphaproteobacteria bacterium]